MQLNEAVSKRMTELLKEQHMTNYQLYIKSGVPKSTIGNLINCTYDSVLTLLRMAESEGELSK